MLRGEGKGWLVGREREALVGEREGGAGEENGDYGKGRKGDW